MRIVRTLLLAIFISIAMFSCETDVDLLAPYKRTPVIVGVLNSRADTQFVRINRTFLAETNVESYAAVKDSVEYPLGAVEAILYKYRDGDLLDSIELQPIDIPSREPGVFYDTDVRFYYTAEELFTSNERANLDEMEYELRVTVPEGTYIARTDFPDITTSNIVNPPNTGSGIPFKVDFTLSGNQLNYRSVPFLIDEAVGAGRYEGVIRTKMDISFSDGSLREDFIFDVTLSVSQSSSVSADLSLNLNSEIWYELLNREIAQLGEVEKVRIENLEFILMAANTDLDNYIDVARPISQFTPVLSTYSNFSGDAIGILGGVSQTSRIFWLSEPSLEIMNDGIYNTANFCYCVQDWAGSNYVCTETLNTCP